MRKSLVLTRAASSVARPLRTILPYSRCCPNQTPLPVQRAHARRPFTSNSVHRAQSDSDNSTPAQVDSDATSNLANEDFSSNEGFDHILEGELAEDDPTLKVTQMLEEVDVESEEPDVTPDRSFGFFALEEGLDEDTEADPEAGPDDISTPAHFELEQQRELREFARVMAWDMPLLYNLRQSWAAPDPRLQPLRFRYSTYMGETHPASSKVVLEFSPSKLPDLDIAQRRKLVKLLGPRYNPSSKKATMSAEYHPTAAQNKRHLGETLQKLLMECRNGVDELEDVPMDFRHHRWAPTPKFPHEWKMTKAKVAELDQARRLRAEAEQTRREHNQLTDGRLIVERLSQPAVHGSVNTMEKTPVRVGAKTTQKL